MLADADLISIQEVRTKVERAYAAFQQFRTYSQERVDAIVEAMAAETMNGADRVIIIRSKARIFCSKHFYGDVAAGLERILTAGIWPSRRIRGAGTHLTRT